MPGGLAIAAASSAAWAVMGAQAETALNSGWILDQRQDGAGGFLSNCSPGSPIAFQSTGDATAFYVTGRGVRVISTTGGAPTYTSLCTIGLSTYSAGLFTSVWINQFSTAAGLSTSLSTGLIVSVGASPLFPRSTDNNTFGGARVIPSTGGAPSLEGMAFGTSAASSGLIRMANSPIAIVGKTSTGGDDIVWPMQFQSTTLTSQIFSSGANGTNIFSKSLAVGTWWIAAGLTIQSTGGTADATVAINNGTTDLFTQQGTFNFVGTTGPSGSLQISGIVSHTTVLTYNIVLFAASTTVKAVAVGGGFAGFGGSTAASWFNAVKIG